MPRKNRRQKTCDTGFTRQDISERARHPLFFVPVVNHHSWLKWSKTDENALDDKTYAYGRKTRIWKIENVLVNDWQIIGKVPCKSHPLASDFLVELSMATLDKTTLKRTKSPKTIICTITIEKSILGKSKTFSKRVGKKLGETWEKLGKNLGDLGEKMGARKML